MIEYCRVTPYASTDKDGNATYSYTQVHNKYDIAVGAVAGQAVYAGGIAGGINNGTQIMDCFSTADCYCYTGTYVSVGAGNVSYVGGIAARANLGAEPKYKKNVIERVHYAGNLHSMQYNAVLVIPIIQYDVNLSGIVERTSGDDEIEVHDAYFNYSATKDLRSEHAPSWRTAITRRVRTTVRPTTTTPTARGGRGATSTSRATPSARLRVYERQEAREQVDDGLCERHAGTRREREGHA